MHAVQIYPLTLPVKTLLPEKCRFVLVILETENSVVILNVFVEDILENGRHLLLTIRPDLCCICAHLKRPPSIRRKAVS